MRLRPLSLTLAALTAALYLSSYSTGPAARNTDATSSGLGGQACGGCHRGGSFGTQTSLTLLDAEGLPQEAYVPGQTYTLRIDIATDAAPGGYGFQVLAIDGANAQAGSYGAAPADTRTSQLEGRTYFEHRRRLSGGAHEIEWTAPAAGTGPVTVYGVGNAVDGNGGTSGDEVVEAVVTLAESGASAIAELAWPTGVRTVARGGGRLEVSIGSGPREAYSVELVGVDGRRVAPRRVLARAPLAYGGLAPGVYVLRLTDGRGATATRMIPVLH